MFENTRSLMRVPVDSVRTPERAGQSKGIQEKFKVMQSILEVRHMANYAMVRKHLRGLTIAAFSLLVVPAALASAGKPNILVIMGDDVGITNISTFSHGIMGYQTPNIDQLVKDGAMMTDYYGEQSCTAGRCAFITGQSPFRVGDALKKISQHTHN